MFKIILFLTIHVFVYHRVHAHQDQIDDLKETAYTKIFEFQTVTSYHECMEISAYFNNAQKLKIPVPGIPLEPITERNVSFVFYSRQHAEPMVANTYDTASFVGSLPINFKLPTVIYVHGIRRTYQQFVPILKNNLLPKQNINICFVDWGSYSGYHPIYSRNNTVPRLGNILAKFLHQYIGAGANPKDIFLIGVSSGAQAVGIAGHQIDPRVGKVLAIDPVGTCYNFAPDFARVSPGDADFVQIVHCSEGKFGLISKFEGDATFYMNGGKIQPQCMNETDLTQVNQCSHNACDEYVFETFKNFNKYVGVKCGSYEKYLKKDCKCGDRAVMGYDTPTKTRGTYYVDTESNKDGPICPV